MRKLLPAFGFAAAAVMAMTSTLLATVPASAEPAPEIDWQPCEDAEGEVYCGTVSVPLDHSDPHGAKIEIGLAKRPATNPDERIGSLLVNPGVSGVNRIKKRPLGSAELRARFDVVGLDPRGVNTSSPQIRCHQSDLDAVYAVGVPTTRKEFDTIAEANRTLAKGCRELTGPLFDHADNLHTVEDIESVRKALGDEKLNFLGYSYGTLMGQQYAERYPGNIRSMVLDGNMDHSLTSAHDFARSSTAAMERNFTSFATWCDSTASCALYGEDTTAVYGRLRDAATNGELTDPESGEPIDFYAFARRTFSANDPRAWPDLAADLKALRDGQGRLTSLSAPEEGMINFVYQSMFCSDWDLGVDGFGDWRRMTKRLAKEFPNTQWSRYNENLAACIGDPIEATNPHAPLDIGEEAPPLVMIGNLNDYATVYDWSVTAARQSGATLITYEGYGHTVYGNGNACVDTPVEDYFIDRTTPDPGISCESQDEPGS